MSSFDMFLGELGRQNLAKQNLVAIEAPIPIKGTQGYAYRSIHRTLPDGKVQTSLEVNISWIIWQDEDFAYLRDLALEAMHILKDTYVSHMSDNLNTEINVPKSPHIPIAGHRR